MPGWYPIWLFSSYPTCTSIPVVAHAFFLAAYFYAVLPSILHIFYLLTQVSSFSFIYILNLFFYPTLIFFPPPYFSIHICDRTDRRRTNFTNYCNLSTDIKFSLKFRIKNFMKVFPLGSTVTPFFFFFCWWLFICITVFFFSLVSQDPFYIYRIQHLGATTVNIRKPFWSLT